MTISVMILGCCEAARMNEEYATIEVKLGTVSPTSDYRRVYRFRRRQVALIRNCNGARSRHDQLTDKTLYQIGENRYIVLLKEWSHRQDKSNFTHFYLEGPEILRRTVITGKQVVEIFPDLANAAGLEFPIRIRPLEVTMPFEKSAAKRLLNRRPVLKHLITRREGLIYDILTGAAMLDKNTSEG